MANFLYCKQNLHIFSKKFHSAQVYPPFCVDFSPKIDTFVCYEKIVRCVFGPSECGICDSTAGRHHRHVARVRGGGVEFRTHRRGWW